MVSYSVGFSLLSLLGATAYTLQFAAVQQASGAAVVVAAHHIVGQQEEDNHLVEEGTGPGSGIGFVEEGIGLDATIYSRGQYNLQVI